MHVSGLKLTTHLKKWASNNGKRIIHQTVMTYSSLSDALSLQNTGI